MGQREHAVLTIDGELCPLDCLRTKVQAAMERGDAVEARRLIRADLAVHPELRHHPEWLRLEQTEEWPDSWLVTAVRAEPPDEEALDTLVQRYWKPLFARCRLLTSDRDAAADLAQEAWCRVLRARSRLKPDGNLLAYLSVVAANVRRDAARRARRAGPMADHRLSSLEGLVGAADDSLPLAQLVADPRSLAAEDKALLKLVIDESIARLEGRAREVLIARVVDGESCASIGQRYGRTEQTISAWVRQALAEVRGFLGESGSITPAYSKNER